MAPWALRAVHTGTPGAGEPFWELPGSRGRAPATTRPVGTATAVNMAKQSAKHVGKIEKGMAEDLKKRYGRRYAD